MPFNSCDRCIILLFDSSCTRGSSFFRGGSSLEKSKFDVIKMIKIECFAAVFVTQKIAYHSLANFKSRCLVNETVRREFNVERNIS
jgi:hypothetical protein